MGRVACTIGNAAHNPQHGQKSQLLHISYARDKQPLDCSIPAMSASRSTQIKTKEKKHTR